MVTTACKMLSEEQCDGPHGETSSLLDGGNNNITRVGTDNPDGGRIVSLLPSIQVLYDYECVKSSFCYDVWLFSYLHYIYSSSLCWHHFGIDPIQVSISTS